MLQSLVAAKKQRIAAVACLSGCKQCTYTSNKGDVGDIIHYLSTGQKAEKIISPCPPVFVSVKLSAQWNYIRPGVLVRVCYYIWFLSGANRSSGFVGARNVGARNSIYGVPCSYMDRTAHTRRYAHVSCMIPQVRYFFCTSVRLCATILETAWPTGKRSMHTPSRP